MLHGQLFHIESETAVNFLNVGILAGSVAVKLPQIIKILAVCENNPTSIDGLRRAGASRDFPRARSFWRYATGRNRCLYA